MPPTITAEACGFTLFSINHAFHPQSSSVMIPTSGNVVVGGGGGNSRYLTMSSKSGIFSKSSSQSASNLRGANAAVASVSIGLAASGTSITAEAIFSAIDTEMSLVPPLVMVSAKPSGAALSRRVSAAVLSANLPAWTRVPTRMQPSMSAVVFPLWIRISDLFGTDCRWKCLRCALDVRGTTLYLPSGMQLILRWFPRSGSSSVEAV